MAATALFALARLAQSFMPRNLHDPRRAPFSERYSALLLPVVTARLHDSDVRVRTAAAGLLEHLAAVRCA